MERLPYRLPGEARTSHYFEDTRIQQQQVAVLHERLYGAGKRVQMSN